MVIQYTRLDPQCRKIHGPEVMDLAPSSTRGAREMHVSFDWEREEVHEENELWERVREMNEIRGIFYI